MGVRGKAHNEGPAGFDMKALMKKMNDCQAECGADGSDECMMKCMGPPPSLAQASKQPGADGFAYGSGPGDGSGAGSGEGVVCYSRDALAGLQQVFLLINGFQYEACLFSEFSHRKYVSEFSVK